jgi:hypothetical protein
MTIGEGQRLGQFDPVAVLDLARSAGQVGTAPRAPVEGVLPVGRGQKVENVAGTAILIGADRFSVG